MKEPKKWRIKYNAGATRALVLSAVEINHITVGNFYEGATVNVIEQSAYDELKAERINLSIKLQRTVNAAYHSLFEMSAWLGIPEKKRKKQIEYLMENIKYCAEHASLPIPGPKLSIGDKVKTKENHKYLKINKRQVGIVINIFKSQIEVKYKHKQNNIIFDVEEVIFHKKKVN